MCVKIVVSTNNYIWVDTMSTANIFKRAATRALRTLQWIGSDDNARWDGKHLDRVGERFASELAGLKGAVEPSLGDILHRPRSLMSDREVHDVGELLSAIYKRDATDAEINHYATNMLLEMRSTKSPTAMLALPMTTQEAERLEVFMERQRELHGADDLLEPGAIARFIVIQRHLKEYRNRFETSGTKSLDGLFDSEHAMVRPRKFSPSSWPGTYEETVTVAQPTASDMVVRSDPQKKSPMAGAALRLPGPGHE